MSKKTVVIIFMLLAPIITQAQQVSSEQTNKKADSLNKILAVTSNPVQRFNIINQTAVK